MIYRFFNIYVFAVLCLGLAVAQDCPCQLLDSARYPGTLKWDCESLHLVTIPGQCYDVEDNVTELYLTDNTISDVRNVDFAGLSELRALYINYNKISFFDTSALAGISHLEYFHAEQNDDLDFPQLALFGKKELIEVLFYGSAIQNVPDITAATTLQKLDARSCGLTSLPRPTFANNLSSSTFQLSLFGNSIVDVAADILMVLPDGATINFDDTVIIWAADQFEKYDLIDKNFNINLDLESIIKVCFYDGSPTDETMC